MSAADDEDRRRLAMAAHVASHRGGEPLICPICGTQEWNALAAVVTPLPTTQQAVPWGFVICRKCGFAHFFSWRVVESQAGNG